jgi:hypothetical protein
VKGSWARLTAEQSSTLKQTNSLNNWEKRKEKKKEEKVIFQVHYIWFKLGEITKGLSQIYSDGLK